MELIYKVKKPETIQRFMHENNIPSKILELEDNHYRIYVNEKIKTKKSTVKKGEKIHFFIKDEPRDKRIKPEEFDLSVIYEDSYLLIVNKPKNMQMMISKAHPTGTLANAIYNHYDKSKENSSIHYVSKLDKEASGLVVIAKHKFIRYLLSDKFDNAITYYIKAILNGILGIKESSIPLPIARQEGSILREISEKGEECLTNYKVLNEFGEEYSLVEAWIKNKKAHQLRVHFAYFYAPVVGDKYYGKDDDNIDLLLYCYKLDFIHPITEEQIKFELIEPEDFKKFLER